MDDQDNPSITRIRVRFFGVYHEIVIDWRDDSSEFKQSQIFDQLETITGISKRHIIWLGLPANQFVQDLAAAPINPDDTEQRHPFTLRIYNYQYLPDMLNHPVVRFFEEPLIRGSYIQDDAVYVLSYEQLYYEDEAKHIFIKFNLIPEDRVVDGVCQPHSCVYFADVSVFNKLKNIIANDALSAKIAELLESGRFDRETIYKKLNLIQYFKWECIIYLPEIDPAVGPVPETPSYIRDRG